MGLIPLSEDFPVARLIFKVLELAEEVAKLTKTPLDDQTIALIRNIVEGVFGSGDE